MRTEKEVKDKLNFLKDNLIELISDDKSLCNINLARLKLVVNTLRWVLGEKNLIMDTKGGSRI